VRFDKQSKEICEKAFLAKAEAFEIKKKRDRGYDKEAKEHAFKHAKLVAQIETLESEGIHGELRFDGSSSGAHLPAASIALGEDAIDVSPNDTRTPPPGVELGDSHPHKEEEGPGGCFSSSQEESDSH
jgi:hypothetical protein